MAHTPTHPAAWVENPRRNYIIHEAIYHGRVSQSPMILSWLIRNDGIGKPNEWQAQGEIDGVQGVDLIAEYRARATHAALTPSVLGAGDYHPLIWRNGSPSVQEVGLETVFLDRCAAALGLRRKLDDVFRFVEPKPANDSAFGHEIRELLILACTEVETSLRAALMLNGYVRPKCDPERWSTKDFVKLLDPLRLAEYEVRLPLHPHWPTIKPFATWDPAQPTTSLSWYDAYNATKHDRDVNFGRGNLAEVIAAVAAVHVVAIAQFSLHEFGGPSSRVPAPGFGVLRSPRFEKREHLYVPAYPGRGVPWSAVPYFTL